MSNTKHHTPDSSTITSIDHKDGKLHVEFKSGGTYHYADVPESIFHEMKAAPSAGKFLHANIKGKFQHAKAAIVAGLLLLVGNAYADSTQDDPYANYLQRQQQQQALQQQQMQAEEQYEQQQRQQQLDEIYRARTLMQEQNMARGVYVK